MNTKAIFFDVDGTLWDENMCIPKSTRVALEELKENGHLLFLCSGRSRSNITSEELLSLGFHGIIAACGNHIEYNGKVVYEYLLAEELVKKIITTCEKNQMPVVLEGPKNHWISTKGFEADPFVDYLWESMGSAARPLKGYEKDMLLNKFSADILPDTDFEAIRTDLEGDFDILLHTNEIVEFVPKNTSKATGIKWVCDNLGIAIENTYAIGDSVNDLDMLEFVSHGIAMGNASEEPRSVAEYVTEDIHADGLYLAMKHYGLI